MVGIAVGAIAGLHRYTLGGFTALSCAISTVVEGLIGGIFKNFIRKGKRDILISFIAGFIAEVLQVIIILIVAKPFEAALELEKNIAMPMILINSFGVALFINIINNIKDDLNKIAAFNAYRALNITKKHQVI
ncbi:LytS/YhcK type 5TM receptor domain-containing protein [Caloramator sp. mosi_1]|uniref:LytS/YhcK type 5TM receptor domain-containing protein n=1 Tax=Caloramator sp. mosi_1 TaxID=3023090 RepID=UPI00235EDEE9|nr:LytS/YhcK type 5TM receptor domain-containing protein [Caloramator sp. mosi_1]WDC85826.1 LytS/YhcK type 5TM receptor domain-containing protein [Caloramator sp. mosi_1]